jgi:hypothetical protein
VPIVYFFCPETAGHSLEDLDRFFVGGAPLPIIKDKDAIYHKRPEKYVEQEREEVRRNSSIRPQDVSAATELHKRSMLEKIEGEGDEEKK